MTNPFNWKFENVVSAYALFFKNDHGTKALRLEVPEIALEFTDGPYIGKDPEGFLYYNKVEDFQQDTNTKHTYHVRDDSINNKTYAVIEFRKSAGAIPYAKFYAPDNYRVATAADMENHTSTGSWVTLKTASCYTTIEKKVNSKTVTATLSSVDKVATWDTGSTSFSSSSFRLQKQTKALSQTKDGQRADKGQANKWFPHVWDLAPNVNKLKDTKWVNYNNDHVVFYENDWTHGFRRFPLEDATQTLGIQSTKTTPALTFSNVKWFDT
ncbi:hypothetical protein FB451DRAFT_1373809 [Mycena latifolia]|nr:hypothetical protein FB451DRAFT_1373809 [Mycena latifolia]